MKAMFSPVQLDGVLYAAIAYFVFSQGYFSGDEAAKVISAQTKFWLSYAIGSGAAVAGALKMYRSTAYADHRAAQNSHAPEALPQRGNAPPPEVPPPRGETPPAKS